MATESSEGEDEGKLVGGSKNLDVDGDLREMTKNAAWSVSSCKPGNGVQCLRDDNSETYWQSDGAQPHLINIQFQKKVKLQLIVLYVDFKLDESYTPSKISIRAGDGFHNLKFMQFSARNQSSPPYQVYLLKKAATLKRGEVSNCLKFVRSLLLLLLVMSGNIQG
ncbi:anaphase-promoting complex subunit 10 isoform X3 [Beta vulgaris subsp. vulgaris]|uniref:anaphase-promoting complex subunit 10 isoform X3 n=1 Tax=Beta vulgaris subsp. vulgaris TaxID=3555 RepID=UPI000540226C|nr:anaphase-promoting complex subunit 10 isoform X3 [Beta vulgaris subsp. vulgaris]